MYDVIIVGARVAGASTAMLLARRGLAARIHPCHSTDATWSGTTFGASPQHGQITVTVGPVP